MSKYTPKEAPFFQTSQHGQDTMFMDEKDEIERNNYYSHMMGSKKTREKLGVVRELSSLLGDPSPPKRAAYSLKSIKQPRAAQNLGFNDRVDTNFVTNDRYDSPYFRGPRGYLNKEGSKANTEAINLSINRRKKK